MLLNALPKPTCFGIRSVPFTAALARACKRRWWRRGGVGDRSSRCHLESHFRPSPSSESASTSPSRRYDPSRLSGLHSASLFDAAPLNGKKRRLLSIPQPRHVGYVSTLCGVHSMTISQCFHYFGHQHRSLVSKIGGFFHLWRLMRTG